jgi:hypothetical protein
VLAQAGVACERVAGGCMGIVVFASYPKHKVVRGLSNENRLPIPEIRATFQCEDALKESVA